MPMLSSDKGLQVEFRFVSRGLGGLKARERQQDGLGTKCARSREQPLVGKVKKGRGQLRGFAERPPEECEP